MRRTRIACALAFGFIALASMAAQKNQPQLRTVRGTVVDKQDNPVSAAVVYLENRKTKVIRTLITDDQGLYRFSGLDPNVDFEIHAELNGDVSSNRTISTFDARNEIVMTLKLDKKRAMSSGKMARSFALLSIPIETNYFGSVTCVESPV